MRLAVLAIVAFVCVVVSSPSPALNFFEFKPMGRDRPIEVYILSREDMNDAIREFNVKAPYDIGAFAVWGREPGKIFLRVDTLHLFTHELRHIQERRNFHGDQDQVDYDQQRGGRPTSAGSVRRTAGRT